MSGTEREAFLKRAYNKLYREVARLVREADPSGFIAAGAPQDEYDIWVPRIVHAILSRLQQASSVHDVHRIVQEEFVHRFGAHTGGPLQRLTAASEDIWKTRQQSAAGLNNTLDPTA